MKKDDDLNSEQEYISKSQLKRQAKQITALGKKLLDMPNSQLNKLNLSEDIINELEITKKIRTKSPAYKRQIQHLGKVLRNDANIEHIINAIDRQSIDAKTQSNKIEDHLTKLLQFKDEYIETLMQEYPNMDRQHLRQLVRKSVNQEQTNNKFAIRLKNYLSEFISGQS